MKTSKEQSVPIDKLSYELGGLDRLSEKLENPDCESEVDQEEVGSWITTIGKAIVSIFK